MNPTFPCPRRLVPVLAGLVLACGGDTDALSESSVEALSPVMLDGEFGDWTDATVVIEGSAPKAATSPIGLGTVRAKDDPAWLFLSFRTRDPVNAQAMPGSVRILFDADGDPSSGHRVHGMEGVEFALDLSRTDAVQPSGYGAGFALREVGSDGPGAFRSAYAREVLAAPTWAARRFELRVRRSAAEAGLAALDAPSVRIKLVVESNGEIVEETPVGSYALRTNAGPDPVVPDLSLLDPPDGTVRVSVWNTASESFQRPEDFGRLLGALAPDVILLDEVFGSVTREFLDAFFASAPLAALGEWRYVLGESGGRQKTVVAARDRAIRPADGMRRVEYADGAIDALRGRTPESFHRLLGLEEGRHVAATGAWVEVAGTEVLFTPLDLESGGHAGGPDDLLRDLQAGTIHRHITTEIGAPGPDRPAVVVGGDFNLVGGRSPIEILAASLDRDGGPLTIASAPRLTRRSDATWQDVRRGAFGPGRLDFVLFAGAALEQLNGFVFDTEDLTGAQLRRLGLERDLSSSTSDHRIVTVDLRVR